MTKTELKKKGVEERREILASIYEDPEGDFPEMNSRQVNEFIDNNWAEMEPILNEQLPTEDEASEAGSEAEGDSQADEDSESQPSEGEVVGTEVKSPAPTDRPNPKTDLYSGRLR